MFEIYGVLQFQTDIHDYLIYINDYIRYILYSNSLNPFISLVVFTSSCIWLFLFDFFNSVQIFFFFNLDPLIFFHIKFKAFKNIVAPTLFYNVYKSIIKNQIEFFSM